MNPLSGLFGNTNTLPFLVAIGALLLFVLVPLLRRAVLGAEPRHEARALLSEWERGALAALRDSVPPGWHVCPQVRIADFLTVTGGSDKARFTANSRIRQRSVDFLLIDGDARPRLVIELDDNSHHRKDRRRRDAQNDAAYEQAGVPVRHIRPGRKPDWLTMIAEVVEPATPPDDAAGADVPVLVAVRLDR